MIQNWLQMKESFFKHLGLQALLPLISQPDNDNLPVFLRMIQPLSCEIPSGLRPDVVDIVGALAQRSPIETAFFLRQTIRLPEARDTAWLIRQSMQAFPADIQRDLRDAVRSSYE